MSDRKFGNQHKYLDPEYKGFESVVYQQDTPVSSSELVLSQEVQRREEDESRRSDLHSGFMTGSFLDDGLVDYDFRQKANQFRLINLPVAHVNGWTIPVHRSNTSDWGKNFIQLDPPPTSSGEVGVDFVWLEAWRALVKADPSTTNKPASDKLYWAGNVLSPQSTWHDDDLKDNPIGNQTGNETSIRVQIQYRIRNQRLATNSNREGFNDSNVSPQGPNGSPQGSFSYTYQPNLSSNSNFEDRGLWVSGGEVGSNNEFPGTADGFIYAIPICLVYRRNSAGFDALNNGNGGLNAVEDGGTPSDRPDGYYSDQITKDDVQDLRSWVSRDFNHEEILERNVDHLFKNNMKTWAQNSAHTPWYVGGNSDTYGTDYLRADDLMPVSSGTIIDKSSGNSIRSPDGICRVFSDRAHHQKHVKVYSTNSDWSNGDKLTLDISGLSDETPDNTLITDVVDIRINDTDGSNGYVEMGYVLISGLDTQTADLYIEDPVNVLGSSSQKDIWVTWEVTYPAGNGLTSHPKQVPSNFEMFFHNPSALDSAVGTSLNSSSDALSYMDISYNEPHREVKIEHTTDSTVTKTVRAKDSTTIVLPEYPDLNQSINQSITVTDSQGNNVVIASVDGRTLSVGTLPNSDDEVEVEYYPLRPLPNGNAEMTVYYRAPSIHAVPEEFLSDGQTKTKITTSLKYVPDHFYSIATGSGSHKTPTSWAYPNSQFPVQTNRDYRGEGDFVSPQTISTKHSDVRRPNGLIRIDPIRDIPSNHTLILGTPTNVSSGQDEYIDYFRGISAQSPRGGLDPFTVGEPLYSQKRHKNVLFLIVKSQRKTSFCKKGELLLIALTEYHGDANSDHRANEITSTSIVSVYKLKGNPTPKD